MTLVVVAMPDVVVCKIAWSASRSEGVGVVVVVAMIMVVILIVIVIVAVVGGVVASLGLAMMWIIRVGGHGADEGSTDVEVTDTFKTKFDGEGNIATDVVRIYEEASIGTIAVGFRRRSRMGNDGWRRRARDIDEFVGMAQLVATIFLEQDNDLVRTTTVGTASDG